MKSSILEPEYMIGISICALICKHTILCRIWHLTTSFMHFLALTGNIKQANGIYLLNLLTTLIKTAKNGRKFLVAACTPCYSLLTLCVLRT